MVIRYGVYPGYGFQMRIRSLLLGYLARLFPSPPGATCSSGGEPLSPVWGALGCWGAWHGAVLTNTPQGNGEAGHSHSTWVRPMATLFFSRSSAWNSSSTAWGEGTRHGTAQEAPTACHELLKWGAETPLSPVRAHPALPSSPCTSAQAQAPVKGLSSPKAFSRMGSRDLQL